MTQARTNPLPPSVPAVSSVPAAAPDAANAAVQEYRIKQLEQQLETLQTNQQAYQTKTFDQFNSTLSSQATLYGGILSTITAIIAIVAYFGWKNIKEARTEMAEQLKKKADDLFSEKQKEIEGEIEKLKAHNKILEEDTNRIKEQWIKQYKLNQRFEAFETFENGFRKHQEKQYEAAIVDYTKAIELQPDYAVAFYNRGIARMYLKQYEAAIIDYNHVIGLMPDYAIAYSYRGAAKLKLQQFDGAMADFTNAIDFDPKLAGGYFNKSCALALMNKPVDEVLASLKMAIDLDEQCRKIAREDDDFISLRSNPDFCALVGL